MNNAEIRLAEDSVRYGSRSASLENLSKGNECVAGRQAPKSRRIRLDAKMGVEAREQATLSQWLGRGSQQLLPRARWSPARLPKLCVHAGAGGRHEAACTRRCLSLLGQHGLT